MSSSVFSGSSWLRTRCIISSGTDSTSSKLFARAMDVLFEASCGTGPAAFSPPSEGGTFPESVPNNAVPASRMPGSNSAPADASDDSETFPLVRGASKHAPLSPSISTPKPSISSSTKSELSPLRYLRISLAWASLICLLNAGFASLSVSPLPFARQTSAVDWNSVGSTSIPSVLSSFGSNLSPFKDFFRLVFPDLSWPTIMTGTRRSCVFPCSSAFR